MYNQKMMSIFSDLKYMGKMYGSDGVGKADDELSLEIVKVYIQVEKNKITSAKAEVFGSAATIVCADYACSLLTNRTLEDSLALDSLDISDGLDLPIEKQFSAELCIKAIKFAIADYKDRIAKVKI